MLRKINPPSFPKPASNYSQGMAHRVAAERLVISGQVGVKADGTTAVGLEAQMEQTWANFLAVLAAGGFLPADVVKVTAFVTVPALAEFRHGRERALGSHAPAATYLQVAGLASPDYLVEIEGEAIRVSGE